MPSGTPPELSGPAVQLRELNERLQAGNPDLYRHLALYLQVLRQVLPTRVERACFHLVTQVQPRRYAALPGEDRRQLHRRLSHLVGRCASLLTVEQLCSLAAQMARERQRQERHRRQRLLKRFSSPRGAEESVAVPPGQRDPHITPERPSAAPGSVPQPWAKPLPEGSVDLDGSRPFSAGLLRALSGGAGAPGFPGGPSARAAAPQDEGRIDDDGLDGDGPDDQDGIAANGLGEHDEDDDQDEDDQDDQHDDDGDDDDEDGDEDDNWDGDDGPASFRDLPPLLQRLMAKPPTRRESRHSASGEADPWSRGQLPEDPLSLLRWLDGIERALARRLRNLSHAINVELLRAGLSGSLLPVSLLDAVLDGQLEPQPAPPNLLRLQLPFPSEDASALQVMAVLLRSVDLELEEPRLRTCRRRLQQHRQEVRRMAQQFRRLQRRREAHEAEQLWLQDRHDSLSPPG